MHICLNKVDPLFINAPDYTNNISGWMADIELKWLYLAAQEMENIVEIGSWKGRSTDALLSGCKGSVWAIDHFKGNEGARDTFCHEAAEKDVSKIFFDNVGHYKNLNLLKMGSLEAVKVFKDKSIDMVFIDGGHSYDEVKNDILAWLPKTKKLICGHDYSVKRDNEHNCNIRSPLQNAVNELLAPIYAIRSIWIKVVDTK